MSGNLKKILPIFIIMVVSVICMIYIGASKVSLSQDETFSYGSSNDERGPFIQIDDRAWYGSELFTDYMNVDKEHRFQYDMVVQNQREDVHPPLYYIILHTVCSVFYEKQFSVWMGLGINLVCILLTIPLLYQCGLLLFSTKIQAIAAAGIYSISIGTMNLFLNIRMYALLQLITAALLYIHLRALQKDKLSIRFYVLLSGTVFLGVMTQYYFLICLFFAAGSFSLYQLLLRRWKQAAAYIGVLIATGLVSAKLYNSMIWHIFGSYRGKEAASNLFQIKDYLKVIANNYKLLDNILFGGCLTFILIAAVILLVFDQRGNKKINLRFNDFIHQKSIVMRTLLLVTAAGYFLVICKVAPYQSERYFTPIYPMLLLAGIEILFFIFSRFIKHKAILAGCLILLSGVPFGYALVTGSYKENERLENISIAKQYSAYNCFYALGTNAGGLTRDRVKENFPELMNFNNVYYAYNDDLSPIEDKTINQSKKLIVYVDHENTIEDVMEWLRINNHEIKKHKILYHGSGATAYLVE